MVELIYVLISGLFASVISIFISNRYNLKRERWNHKYKVLYNLIAYRGNMMSSEFQSAINSIDVIFYDSPKVLNAKKDFFIYSSLPMEQKDPDVANEKLVVFFHSIYLNLKIDKNISTETMYQVFQITD